LLIVHDSLRAYTTAFVLWIAKVGFLIVINMPGLPGRTLASS